MEAENQIIAILFVLEIVATLIKLKIKNSDSEFETPEEVEQLYSNIFKNVKTDSKNLNMTSMSGKSRKSNPQDVQKPAQKDWAETPLFEEFEKHGKNVYTKINETKFFSEDELTRVYQLVKNRYNSKEYDKSVINFYKKAMDTLLLLTETQMSFNTFRKIQSMYSKVDVTNTLKLLLRCSLMYQARRQIVQIFDDIRVFEVLSSRAKNLISLNLDFKGDAGQTTSKMKKVWSEIEVSTKMLLENIISFLKNNKLFGYKWFVFNKKEWLSHWIKEYEKIRNNAQKAGVKMKEIKDLESNE